MEDNRTQNVETVEALDVGSETARVEPEVVIEPQVAIAEPEISIVEPAPVAQVNAVAKPEVTKELSLKDKYGEVYEVELTFDTNEDDRTRLLYCFKKPNVSSYDRYIKSMSKSPAQASRVFVMDNVIKEQKAELAANLEKYPAAAMSISSKLLEMLGFGDASLTLL